MPMVGWWVPHVEPQVGAIASQALCNPYLGIWGLQLLKRGLSVEAALQRVLAADPEYERRQVAVVDTAGRGAAFTGAETVEWQGHRVGDGYVVAGNMLAGPAVVEAMVAVMETTARDELPLAERLVQVLEAAQDAGGDKRGRQSAALRVTWEELYPYFDIRVDDHPSPVAELRRLTETAGERRRTVRYYSISRHDHHPVEGLLNHT